MGKRLDVFPSSTYLEPSGPTLSQYQYRFLAEGDSWFSISDLNLLKTANLLLGLEFSAWGVAFQSAVPGDTLRNMVKINEDGYYMALLTGRLAPRWDAILLSAGGNDLISACKSGPENPPNLRLLRTSAEWGPESDGAKRFVSPEGWKTFSDYFVANLLHMLEQRDQGPSKGRPMCLHCYAYPTPRPAGAGLGTSSWLMPAMQKFGIPFDQWPGVAEVLVDQLAELLLACAADQARFPGLHVFDSRKVPLVRADLGADGESGDWINEIHLTRAGASKVGKAWGEAIEAYLKLHP